MRVGFDTTIVSVLLNPDAAIPLDSATGKPVDLAKERVQALITELQKAKQKIVIPTPVVAEILTVVGPTLNRDIFAEGDRRDGLEPYQKIKIDRQILAICRTAQCDTLYTDDNALANRAKLCDIVTKRLADLPVPDAARQGKLALEQHEELPEIEDEEEYGEVSEETPAAG